MASKAGVSHDITITDGSSVETGFMLARGSELAPRWRRGLSPTIPPPAHTGSQTAVNTASWDFTWEPEDYSLGFGQYRWSPAANQAQQAKYAYSDGVLTDVGGELSLGARVWEADVWVTNPGAERGATTGWTASGDTIAAGTQPNTGTYSFKCTFAGTTARTFSQSLANPNVWKSKVIVVAVAIKKLSGASTETWRVNVTDGVGTTNGTSAVLTSTYAVFTCQRTIDANATEVTIQVERVSATAADAEVHFDDVTLRITTGDASVVKFFNFASAIYLVTSNSLSLWDSSDEVFDAVYINTSNAITDAAVFDDAVYLALGASAAYVYSTAPQTTPPNFTTSTLAGNSNRDQNANHFARVRNTFWKTRNSNLVAFATDPTNGGGWVEIAAGDEANNFTGLYVYNDLPIAAKANGLFVYDRDEGAFFDVLPEYGLQPSSANFVEGFAWHGWLFTAGDPSYILRYDGLNVQEFSFLFESPQFDTFSGRVLAMSGDTKRFYALVDTFETTDANETAWLMTMQEMNVNGSGALIVNTLAELDFCGDANAMLLSGQTLFIAGSRTPVAYSNQWATCYRVEVPTQGAPAHNGGANLRHSGTFVTPYWDGGYPDETKALRTLAIRCANMSATSTLLVEIQIDEDSSWTTLSTITSSGLSTLSIETLASTKKSCKRCRFRFTLSAGDVDAIPRAFPTSGPIVKLPFVLHTSLLPTRKSTFEIGIQLAHNLALLNGGTETLTVAALQTILNGYYGATFPITLKEDFNRDGTVMSYRIIVQEILENEDYEDDKRGHVWTYTLVCSEVPVS